MEAISRAYFWWKDVRYVIRSNEWTKKTRPDHERDAVDGQWFERSIRKENFDFNITFVTTFEIDSMKKKKKKWRSWKEIVIVFGWNLDFLCSFFFFLCFPQILPLGYFFPLIPLINIIRFRNTDGTIKLVVSISVCGRVWNGNKVF